MLLMIDMKFTNEYQYLIHLINCALHDEIPEIIPKHLSMKKVMECGITHEVANIAFLAVKKYPGTIDKSLFSAWQQEYFKAVQRDTLQRNAREEILDSLHSHGIYTLEVQGTVVKRFYPQNHLRMMSDIDIIVLPENLKDAEKVMQEIGYDTVNNEEVEIDACKGNVFVEIHTEFFSKASVTHAAMNDPYSYVEYGDNFTSTVSDTIFYLFHLLHTVKHSTQRGSGLRRIIDLYYLEDAMKDIVDYDYINKVLKEFGFYDTKQALIAVKDEWFCGKSPDKNLVDFEQEIFDAGNHGNSINFYKHKFRKERAEGKHFVKLKYFISFLFPDKESIYESYPICKKRRYPLVFCWIYRAFTIFNPEKFKSFKIVVSRLLIKTKKHK